MVHDGRLTLGKPKLVRLRNHANHAQVFCMATNVFLVFWHGYDARQLRYLEKWYLLFAYGVPGIPPIVYIILNHSSHTRILGPATVSWLSII
jgi:hypothetical protein